MCFQTFYFKSRRVNKKKYISKLKSILEYQKLVKNAQDIDIKCVQEVSTRLRTFLYARPLLIYIYVITSAHTSLGLKVYSIEVPFSANIFYISSLNSNFRLLISICYDVVTLSLRESCPSKEVLKQHSSSKHRYENLVQRCEQMFFLQSTSYVKYIRSL